MHLKKYSLIKSHYTKHVAFRQHCIETSFNHLNSRDEVPNSQTLSNLNSKEIRCNTLKLSLMSQWVWSWPDCKLTPEQTVPRAFKTTQCKVICGLKHVSDRKYPHKSHIKHPSMMVCLGCFSFTNILHAPIAQKWPCCVS